MKKNNLLKVALSLLTVIAVFFFLSDRKESNGLTSQKQNRDNQNYFIGQRIPSGSLEEASLLHEYKNTHQKAKTTKAEKINRGARITTKVRAEKNYIERNEPTLSGLPYNSKSKIGRILENNKAYQAPIAGGTVPSQASATVATSKESITTPKMNPIEGIETEEITDGSTIAGEVKPLLGLITSRKSYSSFHAYAAENCSHPKVGLYHTRDLLKLNQEPIYEHELDPSAKFFFKLDDSIDRSKPQEYSLQVTGCDTYLARIVTGFTRNQNILLSSTIISYTQVSQLEKKPTEISVVELDQLTKALQKKESNYNNVVDAYNELNDSLTGSFSHAFKGETPDKLTTSLPIIKEISIPAAFSEGDASLLKVEAEHWYPFYNLSVEWFIDGVSKGFGKNWNWTPSANSKAIVNIEVRIGRKNNLSNTVDTSIPYHKVTFSRPVTNTILPLAPVLTGPAISNSPLLQLRMTTGPFIEDSFDFCSTFSRLAITEIPISPAPESFTFTCSQEFFQDVSYQISGSNQFDGVKNLYLWAKDDRGEISSSPSTVSLILDQTPASISFDPLAAIYGGGNTLTLNWNFNEQNSAVTNEFKIEFFNGANWSVLDQVPSFDGVAVNEPFSVAFLLPYQNITNARYRINYVDLAGNITLQDSPAFNVRVPELTVSPLSYNFGKVTSQTSSTPISVVFSNIGGWKSAGCGLPTLSGDVGEFAIVSENCSLQSLEANTGSCEVMVMGAPKSKASFNANLSLTCGSITSSMSLAIQGDNNSPTLASPQLKTTNEDIALSFSVQSAVDLDGDALTYSIVSGPANGVLSGCLQSNTVLNCSYTPSGNFFGEDSFTYRAWDGENFSNTALVKITVLPVNDAPTLAGGQTLELLEDSALSFELAQGMDIENDPLTYIIVTAPSHGTLTCTGGASRDCIYTPHTDYFGTDTFSYKVNDGSLDSNTVSVQISILPVNDPPVAPANFALTVDEDTLLSFNLLAGTDLDNTQEELSYTLITPPSHGALSGCLETPNSKILGCSYLPNLNYYGSDSFSYKVCDLNICSTNTTVVSITINSVNDLPVMVSDQVFELTDNDILEFDLTGATDVDVPVQVLRYKITSPMTNGVLEGCIDSSSWKTATHCKFTPPTNFNGEISFQYMANDGEGTSGDFSTVTFKIKDKTPSPKPIIALHSPYHTNLLEAEVTNTTCNDISKLYISTDNTTPIKSDSLWVSCSTSPGALTTTLASLEGTQSLFVWSMDEFENINTTPAQLSVVYDITPPVLNILSRNIEAGKNSEVKFTITEKNASSSLPFLIEYFNGTSWSSWNENSLNGPLTNKYFSTVVSAPNTHEASLSLKVSYTDLAGNTQTAQASFFADQTPPALALFELNNNNVTTVNNNVLVKLEANDDLTPITAFCLKYNDTAKPLADADCWREVNAMPPGIAPNKDISFHNYYFQIGFVKAVYSVYAWVKDETGQVSTNTGLLGIDKFDISFDPGTPPRITNIEATNSNTPNSPIASSDLIANSGSDIFVRWFAEDDEGMQPNPISIEYTTDDQNFLQFSGNSGLNLVNGVNGNCSFGPEFTGCAVLKAPTSNYFRVRVIAKDSVETTVFVNPAPFNDSKLTILAGNTEHGLNGSATTAVFYSYGSTKANSYIFKYNMVMSDDGKFFYLDKLRGLLWVDPQTGALTEFIKKTGTATGENVHISSATLRNALAIVLDAKNNLLIWDTDAIREVNLSTYKIRTLFGKGTQAAPTSKIPASSFKLSTSFSKRFDTLTPLPNGDIIFTSTYTSLTQYRFKAATNEIEPISLTGFGISGYPNEDWNTLSVTEFAVAFNPINSVIEFMAKSFVKSFVGDSYPIFARFDPSSGNATTSYQTLPPHNLTAMSKGSTQTGLDGKLYFVDRFRRNLFQYNHETNALVNILGTGGSASNPCPEETPATSCPVDIDSYFINKTGRVYFLDNGIVRTIDDNKNVITLFGQFPSFGNGNFATLARFGDIIDIGFDKHEGDYDKIIIQDGFSNEFRNFTLGSTIARTATYSYGSTGPYHFEVDSSTGDIFSSSQNLNRFVRASNQWQVVVGNGSTSYTDPSADGKIGSQIKFISSYPRALKGLEDGKLLYYKNTWSGSYYYGCMVKIYDIFDSYRQSHFIGDGTCDTNYAENTPIANQTFETSNVKQITDPVSGTQKYFFTRIGANRMYKSTPGGNLEHFATLAHTVRSFTFKNTDGLKFFYCNSGKLYQYDSGNNVTTHLAWNSPTITCKVSFQQTPLYVPTRNSIIFTFSQNGLDGVAEYKLP